MDNSDNLIINPQFTNEESRRAAEIKYRQSITNKEIFKKVDSKNILNQSNQSENIENENEQDNIPIDTNSINEIKIINLKINLIIKKRDLDIFLKYK